MIDRLFDSKYHLPLKLLGRKKWLDVEVDPEIGTTGTVLPRIQINSDEARQYNVDDINLANQLLSNYCMMGSSHAFFLYQLSQAIADGPKLFKPTFEQCVALENMTTNFSFDDYNQPYPTIILELPWLYRERLKEHFAASDSPTYVIVNKIEPQNVVSVTAWYSRNNLIVNIMGPRRANATLEDALIANRHQHDPKPVQLNLADTAEVAFSKPDIDFNVAEITQRIGINFAFMMTILGLNIVGPDNISTDSLNRCNEIASNKNANPVKKHKANKTLASVVYLTKLNQNIDFYEVHRPSSAESSAESSGTRGVKVGWVKGHYQHYWVGPEHEGYVRAAVIPDERHPPGIGFHLRKFWKMKKAKFHHPELFKGDMSDTSVTYKGKGCLPPNFKII